MRPVSVDPRVKSTNIQVCLRNAAGAQLPSMPASASALTFQANESTPAAGFTQGKAFRATHEITISPGSPIWLN